LKTVYDLRGKGQLEAAEVKCREYCKLRPEDRNGWEVLGQILSQQRRYREAAELCREAASRVTQHGENLLVSAGRYYESARDIDRAREMYNLAYERAPDYSRVNALYNFELRYAPDLAETKWKIEAVVNVSDPPFRGMMAAYVVRCEYEMIGRARSLETVRAWRSRLKDVRDLQNFERDVFSMMCDLLFPPEVLEQQVEQVLKVSEDNVLRSALGSIQRGIRSFPDEYKAFAHKATERLYGKISEEKQKGYAALNYAEILLWCAGMETVRPLLDRVLKEEKNPYQKQRALRFLIDHEIQRGNLEEARKWMKAFEETDPENPHMLRQLGRMLAGKLKDHTGALRLLEKAYNQQTPPQKFYTGLDYARSLRRAGEGEKARKIAETCQAGIGGTSGIRFMAGYLQGEKEDAEAPRKYVESHLEKTKAPKDRADLLLLLVDQLLYREKPQPKKAMEILEEVERISAETRESVFEKERIWTMKYLVANNFLKDQKTVEKYMNLLLSLHPRRENYRLWRAISLARYGESKEEAWREFNKIPPRKSLAYNRACFFSNVGETDKAVDLLRQAIYMSDDPEARNRQRQWAASDDEFRALRNLPAFKELMKREKE
ncbi:MAG: tetratricopeptide repeat protein, partial [Planctomycetota bacterium]